MSVELKVNGSMDVAARYLTWTPLQCELAVTDELPNFPAGPVTVTLANGGRARSAGRLAFRASPNAAPTSRLEMTLGSGLRPTRFYLSGVFWLGQPRGP